MPLKKISQSTIDTITARADLLDVAQHFQPELRKKGKDYKGKCPNCSSDSFTVSPGRQIIKCFSCGQGANGSVGYLMKMQGKTFVEAITYLADRYNILIEYDAEATHPDAFKSIEPAAPPQFTEYRSFRDLQLRASGIPEDAQQYHTKKGEVDETLNRFDWGMVDHLGEVKPGYDMLLHYLDLDGNPIMYKMERARNKLVPFIRIRYAVVKKDKDGKEVRYHTPTSGGSHLWIPEYIRSAFRDQVALPVLTFIEGEKKAEALCLAEIPAVGIAGINNFSTQNEMPEEIERLIKSCGVKSVVFFLDADYDDLGRTIPTPADLRPRTFFKAAIKFKQYFEDFGANGYPVELYIAHGINREYKGMDDLLVHLRGDDPAAPLPSLAEDLNKAMFSHEHAGQHIRTYNITTLHPQRIEEIWNIHSVKAFRDHHAARLKEVPEFRLHGVNYNWDKETSTFIVSDKLMSDEKYWRKFTNSRDREEYQFYNTGFYEFLFRRGYGQLEIGNEQYRLVHVERNIVTAVDHVRISRFVIDFTRAIDEPEVLEMIYKGGRMYLGPDRLSNLPLVTPAFFKPQRDRQFMFFTEEYWEITPKGITSHKYTSLHGAVWKDDIIPFAPKLIEHPVTLKISGEEDHPRIDLEAGISEDSDILRYFMATSDILWRTAHDKSDEATLKRVNTQFASMADKIIATGYVLSNYMDPGLLKAIVCMDALESENGRSEGGTGKSIWATMFEHVIPTKVISAKNPRLTEDPHLYEVLDDRTRVVVLDDCRRNLDFESFLSDITRGITSNPKGLKRLFLGPKRMVFTTNHSIRGEDRSYVRRQYILAFSDYFNLERTPYSEFKHAMFAEWDHDQFNWFYNFMAGCLQMYMIHGLKTFAPSAYIERRKLRDFISEPVLEFLETYFHHGSKLINHRHQYQEAIKYYLLDNPNQRPYVTTKYFRERVKAYAKYAGLQYNPAQKGGRIRDGSKNIEFFVLAYADYSPGMHVRGEETPSFADDKSEEDIFKT